MKGPVVLVLFLITAAAFGLEGITLDPPGWDFGVRVAGTRLHQILRVTNTSLSEKHLTLTALCDCLSPREQNMDLQPGETQQVNLGYDPGETRGVVHQAFAVLGPPGSPEQLVYRVTGRISAPGESLAPSQGASGPGNGQNFPGEPVILDFYGSPGCGECENFLGRTVNEAAQRRKVHFEVRRHDVYEPGQLEALELRLGNLKTSLVCFPVLIEGNEVWQGLDSLGKDWSWGRVSRGQADLGPGASAWALGPLVAAALVDGVNPCAFTALLFLLSYLALAGRTKGEILGIGLCYTLAVFVTNTLVGWGLFHLLRSPALVSGGFQVVKTLMAVLLWGAMALNWRDAWRISRGRAPAWHLPGFFQGKIRSAIRHWAADRRPIRLSGLIIGSLSLGFLVTVLGLACTGQVYLPVIAAALTQEPNLTMVEFLLAYNLVFILPLLTVFTLVFWGIRSTHLANWFKSRLGLVKAVMGFLFLVLSILLLFPIR